KYLQSHKKSIKQAEIISITFLKPLSDKGFKGGGEEQNRSVLKALQNKVFRVL
ncbi:unnamed protein product, partial [marine sediment metagenome]